VCRRRLLPERALRAPQRFGPPKRLIRGIAPKECRSFEADVVLLDLRMPEMSGVEVLEDLRRDRPTLRVIVLTGNEDVEVARATLRAGAFDYLGKPWGIDVLARVVAAAVALPI
jgi:FixJ family two-component response regulator